MRVRTLLCCGVMAREALIGVKPSPATRRNKKISNIDM